ncbi:MAG: heat-inducible transcriptional repressor HrcA [Acidobacteria bacterium]|nr:heat-inducible transcriptional repressor HrcA [Acidobacteriota bacterium]
MPADATLSARAQEVLYQIVRTYIETGEPVGSRTVAKSRHEALSPATIRNTMADLADAGYLSQPHTSAGRVPTDKAFRLYARSLATRRISEVESVRLRSELGEVHTVEERIERCSRILMELTRNVGIAAALPATGQELDQIELVPLADRRILMILVTRDHMVRNRAVALEEPIQPEDLVSIRNYVNRNFSGWRLEDARRELLRRMMEDQALFHAVHRHLEALYQRGLLDSDVSGEVHMEGAANLIGLDLHLTREKMRDLLRALEEKQRLIELLDRFLELPGDLKVQVGLEEVHPAMKELALIGICFSLPSGLSAKVAVLGPMRMHYQRVISAVLHTGYALENLPF